MLPITLKKWTGTSFSPQGPKDIRLPHSKIVSPSGHSALRAKKEKLVRSNFTGRFLSSSPLMMSGSEPTWVVALCLRQTLRGPLPLHPQFGVMFHRLITPPPPLPPLLLWECVCVYLTQKLSSKVDAKTHMHMMGLI